MLQITVHIYCYVNENDYYRKKIPSREKLPQNDILANKPRFELGFQFLKYDLILAHLHRVYMNTIICFALENRLTVKTE